MSKRKKTYVLLVIAIVSAMAIGAIGITLAKFVTSDSFEDTSRVAAFGAEAQKASDQTTEDLKLTADKTNDTYKFVVTNKHDGASKASEVAETYDIYVSCSDEVIEDPTQAWLPSFVTAKIKVGSDEARELIWDSTLQCYKLENAGTFAANQADDGSDYATVNCQLIFELNTLTDIWNVSFTDIHLNVTFTQID